MYTGAVQRTNDVYCGPSFFVSHICTESAIFATTTDTLDTALTPKTGFVALACYCIQTQRTYDRQVSVGLG